MYGIAIWFCVCQPYFNARCIFGQSERRHAQVQLVLVPNTNWQHGVNKSKKLQACLECWHGLFQLHNKHQLLATNTNVPEQKDKEQVYVFTASEYERVEETTAEDDNIYSLLAALGRVDATISRLYCKEKWRTENWFYCLAFGLNHQY